MCYAGLSSARVMGTSLALAALATGLGWSLEAGGKSGTACRAYESCLALGRHLRGKEEYEKAIRTYQEALKLRPKSFDALHELGSSYIALRRRQEAIRPLEAAIRLQPGNFEPYAELARNYSALGKWREAKKILSASLERTKGHAREAYVMEGYAGMSAGRALDAEEAFKNAIAVDSANPTAYHHMGSFLRYSGRYLESEAYYAKALKLEDGNISLQLSTLGDSADGLQVMGDFARAESRLRQGLALAKGTRHEACARCRFGSALAAIFLRRGDGPNAEQFYADSAAACEKTISKGRCMLFAVQGLVDTAYFYAGRGQNSKARDLAENAENAALKVESYGLDQVAKPLPWLSVARLYIDLHAPARAENLYRKVLARCGEAHLSPQTAFADKGLADLARREGRRRQAEALYLSAIQIFRSDGLQREAEETQAELRSARTEPPEKQAGLPPARRHTSKNFLRQMQAQGH